MGRITLVDHDVVDLTNLQRQIAHTTQRVGQPKDLDALLVMLCSRRTPAVSLSGPSSDTLSLR